MTKETVYQLRPDKLVKGLYELTILQKNKKTKTFIGKNRKKLFAEVDHAIESENKW